MAAYKFKILSSCHTGTNYDSTTRQVTVPYRVMVQKKLPRLEIIVCHDAYWNIGTVLYIYRGSALTRIENLFNYYHSRRRVYNKQEIGIVTGRWETSRWSEMRY